MYKNKLKKILFGISVFMFASINVFAADVTLRYNNNDGYLTMWFEANAPVTGLWANCYPYTNYPDSNPTKNENQKEYVLFAGTNDTKKINNPHINEGNYTKKINFPTGWYVCDGFINSEWLHNYGTHEKEVENYVFYHINKSTNPTKKPTTTKPKSEPKPSPTTFSVSFNENGGSGLECNDSSWSIPSPGICKKTGITSGTSISVPKTSNTMTGPEGLLIGWTKTDCNQGNIIKDSSVKVTSNSEYKACYRENIGGYRYLQNGFLVEGYPSQYQCGDSIYIEYCTKESSGDYCYYYNHNNSTYVKINRNGLVDNSEAGKQNALATCGKATNSSNEKSINKDMYALTNGKDYVCGEALYVTTCIDNVCNYNKISKYDGSVISSNGTIRYNDITDNNDTSKKTCEKLNVDADDKKCDDDEVDGVRGTSKYTVCYESGASKKEITNKIKKYYICPNGYKLDETSISADSRESCNDKNTICSKTYEVTCVRKDGKYKPTLEVSSGNIGSDGRTGVIRVQAKSTEGRIIQYYASPIYKTPTETTRGWVDVSSDSFTISETPGIYYIWVKDNKGNISDGIGGAVFDTVNANTTINSLEIQDSNGGIQNPLGNTAYKVDGITDSSYVRLSNNLINGSNLAENGFNPYTMEYKIEVDTPTISVYATLTSSDSSYVSGYEPRTVNLDYGMNTVLIKIQNKEGKVRTYTILVNRKDSRTADNTLSDLSIDVGKIEFNSNKTEYKIEIPVNTEKVNVNATIGNNKATFVDGYKPGIVNIEGDTTVSFIKVMSETGSTRTYVLTFIKEGTDVISKKNLMLSDLVIPGVYVAFEEEIVNYNISVAYETELINLNYDLKDSESLASVYFKGKNDSEYRSSSNQGIKLDVGENFVEIKVINAEGEESFYRLTIIRKEFGLGISNDTSLKDLSVLGYEIDYEPNKKEYTVRIKQEKSLVITAIPNSNRAEVFIRGNDELTGFSTVRVKVIAENGEFDTYSIDIKKDAFNKTIEIAAIIAGVVIILGSSCIIVLKNKNKKNREYYEE